MNEKELTLNKKIKRGRMINIILIFVIIALLAFIAFKAFKVDTEARQMLREGKNVLLALNMINIEYYSTGQSVYDPDKRNGLSDGVEERISEINGVGGTTMITSYKASTREIRAFIYERDHYRVSYSYDKSGKISWKIDYIYNYASYEAESKQ